MRTVGKLLSDKRGVATIEYALIATLISVAALGAFQNLGNSSAAKFNKVDGELANAL